MAKRDFIYDTPSGRTYLWVMSVLLIAAGLAMLVLYLVAGSASKNMAASLIVAGCSILFGVGQIIVLRRKAAERMKKVALDEPVVPLPESEPLPEEPDERIVVNPARINEPTGSVLLYREQGVLVYDGVQIHTDSIRDITFNNVANAYLTPEYHIILVLSDGRSLHIPAGMDGAYAQEAAQELQDALDGKRQ